jgi:hypothetical protein
MHTRPKRLHESAADRICMHALVPKETCHRDPNNNTQGRSDCESHQATHAPVAAKLLATLLLYTTNPGHSRAHMALPEAQC